MPKLTIGRAAKLYGLHRSTLYEAIAKGHVTTSFDGKGHRVIDLSEMIRRYGEPDGYAQQNPTPKNDALQNDPTPPIDDLQQAMLDELKALRLEVKELRETLLLITHQPAKQGTLQPIEQSKPVERFSDLLKMLD